MSLLIDALKQAEARRESAPSADAGVTAADPELRLEPLETGKTTATTESAETRRSAQERDAAMRAAAHDMFRAKSGPPRSTTFVALVAAAVVLLCMGGVYVWWMLQPHGGLEPGPALAATANTPRPLVQSAPLSTPAAALEADAPASAPIEFAALATQSAPMPATSTRVLSATPRQATLNASPTGRRVQVATRDDEAGPSFEVRRGAARPLPSNGETPIVRAYKAYQIGNYPQARALYQDVLRTDTHNADALLALGLIALRDGQNDIAARYLRDAAAIDPKNATAQSQLALLQADADPVGAESRLRTLLAGQPDSASAQFALGSVLARQTRWNEAQQAFFQAYTLDSGNPDILYNLAVSLDQLRQPALARDYYERANQAAQQRPASFDTIRAMQRAMALSATSAAPAANR
ncbi:MAG: tetratricopeptide repeat protein [Rhodocyclaceae bacterium]